MEELRHIADAAATHRMPGTWLAQSGDAIEEGGLANAIGPEDGQHVSTTDLKGIILEDRLVRQTDTEIGDLNHRPSRYAIGRGAG
jgi:hypothetical protein